MSGTSLDGLDVAICHIAGFGEKTDCFLEYHTTIPYLPSFKKSIQKVFAKKKIDFSHLCQLNAFLGNWYAEQINLILSDQKIRPDKIDLIASHGQTVQHIPHPTPFYNRPSTLQIGDADHLALKTGIITFSDFRQKNIAAGGEGAPLAVYGDKILYSSQTETRVLVNLGGIANFTFLPKNNTKNFEITTDTGPANTLIDQYCKKHLHISHDKGGAMALQGKVNTILLKECKLHPFFQKSVPKSTGQETFHLGWIEEIMKTNHLSFLPHEDILTTLSQLTVETLCEEITKVTKNNPFSVYVSGGGSHNKYIMSGITKYFMSNKVETIDVLGMPSEAKEAVIFAILANEALFKIHNPPKISAAPKSIEVSLGKISFPW